MKEAVLAAILDRELEELRDHLRWNLEQSKLDAESHCSRCYDYSNASADARADFIEDLLDRFPILKDTD